MGGRPHGRTHFGRDRGAGGSRRRHRLQGHLTLGPFPPATARRGPGPPFLTVVQIGDELAVGPHVVYDLVRKGGLPARQVGAGQHQVERQRFEQQIADQYQQTRH